MARESAKGPASSASSSSSSATSKGRGWRIAGIVVGALVLAGAGWWMLGERWYTDGRGVRVTAPEARLREVLWTEPRELAGPINTARQEYEPALSADGDELFFVRGKADGERGADLYVCRRQAGGWSEPVPVAGVNTPHDELGPALSPDGALLYFYSDRPGGSGQYDLWAARRRPDGTFGDPFNLGPAVNSPHNEYSPAPSPDGRRLFFASNRNAAAKLGGAGWRATIRQGDIGDYDLFYANVVAPVATAATTRPATRPATGPATRPLATIAFAPAAPVEGVNTDRHEGACAVAPAGDFLYFASNRPGGYGGFDLYRVRLLTPDDDAPNVGEVENLGPQVNAAGNEADPHPTAGGFRLYFSSDRGGDGKTYRLFSSDSREVYALREARPTPPLGWSWLIFLLTLAALLPLLLYLHGTDGRRLSLIQRCLLASLILHLLLTAIFSGVMVTRRIIAAVVKPRGEGMSASLGSAKEAAVVLQVRHQVTDLGAPAADPQAIARAELPTPAPAPLRPVEVRIPEARPEPSPLLRLAAAAPRIDPTVPPATSAPRRAPAVPEVAPAALAAVEVQRRAPVLRDEAPLRPQTAAPGALAQQAPAPESSAESAPPPAVALAARPAALPARPNDAASLAQPAAVEPGTVGVVADAPVRAEPQPVVAEAVTALAPVRKAPIGTHGPDAPASPEVSPEGLAPQAPAPAVDAARPPEVRDPTAVPAAPTATSLAQAAEMRQGPLPTPPELPAVAAKSRAVVEPAAPVAAAAPLPKQALPAADARPDEPAEPQAVAPVPAARQEVPVAEPRPDLPTLPESAPRAAVSATPSLVALPADASPLPVVPLAALPATRPVALAAADPAAPAPEPALPAAAHRPILLAADDALPPAPVAAAPRPIDAAPLPTPAVPAAAAPTPLPTISVDAALPPPSVSVPAPLPMLASAAPSPAAIPPMAIDAPAAAPRVSLTPAWDQGRVALPEKLSQRSIEQRLPLLERLGGTPESEEAVARALAYLARNQEPDGRWTHVTDDRPPGKRARDRHDPALTALTVLAFLAADHTHAKPGPYRDAVGRALDFLLALPKKGDDGDLRGAGDMYDQAIVTIALAEAAIMTGDERCRDAALAGARFIVKAIDRSTGGWRYVPGQAGDTSVVGWQIMALKSVQNLDAERGAIPPAIRMHALRFLDSAGSGRGRMLAGYLPGGSATPPMTAEAAFARVVLGYEFTDAQLEQVTEYLLANPPGRGQDNYYYWYYGSLALMQLQGESGGEAWRRWNPLVRDRLVKLQRRGKGPLEGSWDYDQARHGNRNGRIYSTAIATLTLEVYYRYLPMYAPGRAAQTAE